MRNLEETFEYDNQNRLKRVRLGPTLTGASVYDSYGRMTAKTANGQVVFYDAEFNTTAKPHAMDAATTFSGVFPVDPQTITYTGFDKVKKIKQGADSLCYTYGYDHQRIFMEEHVGNRHRTKITGPVVDNIPIPTFWIYGKPYYIQPSVHWGGPFDFHFSNTVYIKP